VGHEKWFIGFACAFDSIFFQLCSKKPLPNRREASFMLVESAAEHTKHLPSEPQIAAQ
jgi:hypothetical protein